ncbi:serine protease inhibitor dipetalogastin-like [Mizuhopecten yessoensis]|uniref:serine protease inhibitor dipetalogastin-like n=1 Tax=Mizuhopecten yessoensis TaxID=6573 RepID=UPI000B458E3B|nr:serine protease inhibitor dipetalogastin-like [Mizuhopecten yessoensis]
MKLTLVIFAVCVSVALTATVDEEPDRACACSMDLKPVCGTDRKTYGNDCMRNCKNNIHLLHEGECEEEDECVCNQDYRPVCGDDDVTYSNDCSRECAGVNNVHEGSCDSK